MDCADTQHQHSETIRHLLVLKFITRTLLECRPNRLELSDELETVENALRVLRVSEYLNLIGNEKETGDSLLNLGDYCNSINLTYTAQKTLRNELVTHLRVKLGPIVKVIEKMRADLPEMNTIPGSERKVSSSCMELLSLESQRRECMEKLGELNNQKMQLLKAALELKLGPQVCNELIILHAEMRLSQTKANLMRKYIINEFVKRSQYSPKAIKEVEGYIDLLLDEQNEEQKLKSEKI